jgi:phosphonopyruvate decarboxylase
MIEPQAFYELLGKNGIDFFSGVPDSLLKDICGYIADTAPAGAHVIAANEGGALALVAGHYLATGKPGMVYLQNSGEGNLVNPLTSLTDPEVYGIPALLLVGWRAEPGVKDEPQHVKQGRVTIPLFEALEIPHAILPDTLESAEAALMEGISTAKEKGVPYALIVKKGTFAPYAFQKKPAERGELTREEAVKTAADALGGHDVVVSTTGMASRELFEHRESKREGHAKDFLTVGSMGHASQIALGIALAKPERNVWCFDGDGAAIMHMGSLAVIGSEHPKNFRHIVLNNASHESVGGQPTASRVDFPGVAKSAGYAYAESAETKDALIAKLSEMKSVAGPAFLEIRVKAGHRKDLGRPTTTPAENKKAFMDFLSG